MSSSPFLLYSFCPRITSFFFYFFFTLIIITIVQLFKLCNFRYHLSHCSLMIILQNTSIVSLTLYSIMAFCIPHTHTHTHTHTNTHTNAHTHLQRHIHIQISSNIKQCLSTSLPTILFRSVFSLTVPVE